MWSGCIHVKWMYTCEVDVYMWSGCIYVRMYTPVNADTVHIV